MSDPREGDQLLADILAHPDDDDLRLIYADWLEDRGGTHDAGRAALIRGQIEVERTPCLARPAAAFCFAPSCRRCVLDRDLTALLGRTYAGTLLEPRETEWIGRGLRHAVSRRPTPKVRWGWRRGFVEAVACPLEVWLRVGGAVLEEHPVRRVTDPDRYPDPEQRHVTGGVCSWTRKEGRYPASAVPPRVFDLMPGLPVRGDGPDRKAYSSPSKARDALSDALLLAVRPRAG